MIVGGEHGNAIFFNEMPGLKIRDGHAYTQLTRFVTAGNDTAVVVAEHCDRFVPEIGPEDPLTGAVKAIAVDDRLHILISSMSQDAPADRLPPGSPPPVAGSQRMYHIRHHSPDRKFRRGKVYIDGR